MEAVTVQEVTSLFGSALHMVALYRQAREQWKEANPNDQGELPDESVLFDLLGKGGQALKDHAAAIIAKYAAAPQAEPPPAPVQEPPVNPSEPPAPPIAPVPAAVKARPGLVRPLGKAVQDDGGLFNPLGMTLFWALWGWKNQRDRVLAHLDYIARAGFDYVRSLGQVNWPEQTIDPSWPDYEQVLGEYIDAAYDRGLRVELTLIGGGVQDPMDLCRKVANVVSANRTHKIMDLEVANEAFQNFQDVTALAQAGRYLRDSTPNLVALSSPGDWAAMQTWAKQARANLFTVHSDRGPGDNKWRQVRQGWDFKDLDFVVSNNEPPGPASSVATQDNPLQLAMMRAVGIVSGAALYVLHVGAGVTGRADPARGRPADIWDTPNIEAMMSAVRNVDQWLPGAVENWPKANTGWTPPNPVAPFQPGSYWPGDARGVNKAYSAVTGDAFVQLPCGILQEVLMTASYDLADVSVFDPVTGETAHYLTEMKQGEHILLLGRQDTMAAFIIRGARA